MAHQDGFDIAVIRAALEIGLPTLAICRGMQILNVVQGGTLIQHLAPSLPEEARLQGRGW